jgi:glycosyltransferase involved in cell wall biosynthesis
MPVFNGEKYLNEAIDSILNQTFVDFEFIIIDDGSSDHSIDIVRQYDDSRIVLITNVHNLGLAKALNKGINLARGRYIARMDQDDISLPDRLAKQITFFEKNPSISMVGCQAILIDSDSNDLGMRLSEPQTVEEIKAQLPKMNCIVHPSVMVRGDVAKAYRYSEKMVAKRGDYEDYELWLRLLSDNYKIAKIPEVLIKYRVHTASFMGQIDHNLNDINMIRTKIIYILSKIKKLDFKWIDYKVTHYLIMDIIHWITLPLVNKIKIYFKEGLVGFGKCMGLLIPSRKKSSVYLFISRNNCKIKDYGTIINYLWGIRPYIFYTNKAKAINNYLKKLNCYDISSLIKYTIIKYIIIGIISAIINKNIKTIVIGVHSVFFYHLIIYLKPEIMTIDLLFVLEEGLAEASSLVLERLNTRIVNNLETKEYLQSQYKYKKLNYFLKDRIIIASNMGAVVSKIITNSI